LWLSHAKDLGADILSEAQVSIIKRVSAMEAELEAAKAPCPKANRSISINMAG
jgi:hypothetical protein